MRAIGIFGSVRATGHASVAVATSRAAVARAILAVAHACDIPAQFHRTRHARGHGLWLVTMPASALEVAKRGTRVLPARDCCRRTLLRAAFLTAGSVSDPARGYHLEFSCKKDDAARWLGDLIARLGGDVGMARRRGRPLVYVKDAQTISMLLANLGATHALLRLEEQRAVRQTKNAIRRTVNSEAANAKRAAASAARQRDAAQHVLAAARTSVSTAVREAARLRIAHPTRTLRELAKLSRPPISKAAMANRMRLLERLAKR